MSKTAIQAIEIRDTVTVKRSKTGNRFQVKGSKMLINGTIASVILNNTNQTDHWPTFNVTKRLTTIFGILSILGTIFIFITYFIWKDIRTNSRKILIYISFADMLVAVCHISGVWYIPPLDACIVQAFFNIFSMMSSTFWTAAMAIYLYVTTCRRQLHLARRMMFWFHIVCWFVPLVVAVLAYILRALGRSGFLGAAGWCWVQTYNPFHYESRKKGSATHFYLPSHMEQILWMILTDYLWKVLAFGIIIILYTLLRVKLKEAMKMCSNFRDSSERRAYLAAAESERKLMFVPLMYVFLYIWGVARFFIFVYDKNLIYQKNWEWLTALQGVGSTSQGFTNFLFYCFLTNRFMDPLRRICRYCICCIRSRLTTGEDVSRISSTVNTSTVDLKQDEGKPFLTEKMTNYQTSDRILT